MEVRTRRILVIAASAAALAAIAAVVAIAVACAAGCSVGPLCFGRRAPAPAKAQSASTPSSTPSSSGTSSTHRVSIRPMPGGMAGATVAATGKPHAGTPLAGCASVSSVGSNAQPNDASRTGASTQSTAGTGGLNPAPGSSSQQAVQSTTASPSQTCTGSNAQQGTAQVGPGSNALHGTAQVGPGSSAAEQKPEAETNRTAEQTQSVNLASPQPQSTPSVPPPDILSSSPPGTVGLENLGNTCFINSSLQSLLSLRLLVQYFVPEALGPGTRLPDVPPPPETPDPVEVELRKLFRMAYLPKERIELLKEESSKQPKQAFDSPVDEKSPFAPASFIKTFMNSQEDLVEGRQDDAHDFKRLLVEKLSPDLVSQTRVPLINAYSCTRAGPGDSCLPPDTDHCALVPENPPDLDIKARLPENEEAAPNENADPNTAKPQLPVLRLEDMVETEVRPECIDRRCDLCGKAKSVRRKILTAERPRAMTVNVVRGKYVEALAPDGKMKIQMVRSDRRVAVPLYLGVYAIDEPREKTGAGLDETVPCAKISAMPPRLFAALAERDAASFKGTVYRLSSVVRQMGSTGYGHYIAAARNPLNGQWYEYNDGTVTPITRAPESSPDYTARLTAYLGAESRQREFYSVNYERMDAVPQGSTL